MAQTPVILYDSAGIPIGSFAGLDLRRVTPTAQTINGVSYQVAIAPATGTLAANSADLGVYIAEKLTLNLDGTLVQREGAIGETKDKALVRKDPTLTVTFQAASYGTPLICPGDCFEDHIGTTAASTKANPVAIALSRWFVDKNGVNYDQKDPTKFAVTFQLDRDNSSANLFEF